MPLDTGTKLGHYEVLSQIGAGAMGEVYCARDTKLGRLVAVKVLPVSLAQDPERLARFEREAKLLASLNHPNIAQIYGIEERAIVMELVEGEALKGPLALETALNYAKQISNVLEAAHEKGITHRDLKPANIMVTPAGVIKVLDFGLAAVSQPSTLSNGDPTNSPTLTLQATQVGLIMGTAAYMSPEQACGKPVDKRADIWSFGVVLWEMLSGKRLFSGETISLTLASVLKDPIELDVVKAPPQICKLVARCLDRNPKDRLRDIGEARVAIEGYLANPAADAPQTSAPRGGGKLWIAFVTALSLALAVVSVLHFRETPPELPRIRGTILPPDNATFAFNRLDLPALSPDGKRIVFAANTADGKTLLWVRSLDGMTVQPLAGTDGASLPFWSPDSRFIAFFADQKLKKIAVSGGPAITLVDTPSSRGGSWGSQGSIVFTKESGQSGLEWVSASGGPATPLPAVIGRMPWFLPDGRHFLYEDFRRDPQRPSDARVTIRVASLEGKEGKALLNADSNAVYAQGHLLYLRGNALMAQPFDAKKLETTGEAVPVAEGVEGLLENGRIGVFSVSETGLLVFHGGEGQGARILTWFDRAGNRGATVGEPANLGQNLERSPDQKSLAVQIADHGVLNVWIYDLSRGLRTRLTFDNVGAFSAVWSPDGRALAFASRRKEGIDLYQKPANGAGPEELLYTDASSKVPDSWSPDGRFLLYEKQNFKATELWALPLRLDQQSGPLKPLPVVQTPFFNAADGRFSPDGRWIVYQSDESGRYEIYAVSFPPSAAGGKRQISNAGGASAQWRRDGKEIFYLGPDNRLMAAEIAVKEGALEVGKIQPLFLYPSGARRFYFANGYDVTADGQRFLMPFPVGEKAAEPLTLIQNWAAELKK